MEHDLELYIQIRDGQPFEHPISGDNFREVYPDIDTNNLPDTFAKFIRVAPPRIGTYEVYVDATYQWDNGVVKDVHIIRPMTDEERATKTAELENEANSMCAERIEFINQMLATNMPDAEKTVWNDCLLFHKAWVLSSVDPITPEFPRFPIKDESGSWIAP